MAVANVAQTYDTGGDVRRACIVNVLGVVSTVLIKGWQNHAAASIK